MSVPLDLPPPYRAVVLREMHDAFAHAQTIAADAGAGTLTWVGRFDHVEAAIVLEPDEPLRSARRAIYAVMNAAGDALAAHCPPEKPLAFAWPDTILLDGGIIGGVRLAWPSDAPENEPPPWLVAGVMLRLVFPLARATAHGTHPLDIAPRRGTSLEIEGFDRIGAADLVGGIARHLMVQIDMWREDGFAAVARQYFERLPATGTARRGIDTNGDLLVHGDGGTASGRATPAAAARTSLVSALSAPQWRDPDTGEPWL